MSGGWFDYRDAQFKNDVFGYSWSDEGWNGRDVLEDRELSEMLFDLLNLMHDFDWYKSADTGEEDYLKAKVGFKNKWLKNPRIRVQRVIDSAVEDLRQEMYKTYGVDGNVVS